eukprot:sb/3469614/
MHYQELMPIYFPRNSTDYIYQSVLPAGCNWGAYGEPMRTGQDGYIRAQWSTSEKSLARTLKITRTDFATMRDDPDSARQLDQEPDIYSQLLKWARTEDLTRVAMCRAVYQSGYNSNGQAIVIVVGQHFPIHLPLHIVESYYVQVMDSLTTKPYCLVYFHTGFVHSVHASTIHKVNSNVLQSDPDLVASSEERVLSTKSGWPLNRGQIPLISYIRGNLSCHLIGGH